MFWECGNRQCSIRVATGCKLPSKLLPTISAPNPLLAFVPSTLPVGACFTCAPPSSPTVPLQLNPHLYYRKWCYVEEIIYIPCDRKHKVRGTCTLRL